MRKKTLHAVSVCTYWTVGEDVRSDDGDSETCGLQLAGGLEAGQNGDSSVRGGIVV
jgi:hypothetical protein